MQSNILKPIAYYDDDDWLFIFLHEEAILEL